MAGGWIDSLIKGSERIEIDIESRSTRRVSEWILSK